MKVLLSGLERLSSPGGEHLPRRRVDVDDPEGLDVLLADHGDDADARRNSHRPSYFGKRNWIWTRSCQVDAFAWPDDVVEGLELRVHRQGAELAQIPSAGQLPQPEE